MSTPECYAIARNNGLILVIMRELWEELDDVTIGELKKAADYVCHALLGSIDDMQTLKEGTQ